MLNSSNNSLNRKNFTEEYWIINITIAIIIPSIGYNNISGDVNKYRKLLKQKNNNPYIDQNIDVINKFNFKFLSRNR